MIEIKQKENYIHPKYEYYHGCFFIDNPKSNYTLDELYELVWKCEHHPDPFLWRSFFEVPSDEELKDCLIEGFQKDYGRFFYYNKEYNILEVYFHYIWDVDNKKIIYIILKSCENFEQTNEWKMFEIV